MKTQHDDHIGHLCGGNNIIYEAMKELELKNAQTQKEKKTNRPGKNRKRSGGSNRMSMLMKDSGDQIPSGTYMERAPTPEEEEAIRVIEAARKRESEKFGRK